MFGSSHGFEDNTPAPESGVRRTFGTGLVLLGSGLAIWVIFSLFGLLRARETPPLVTAVVPAETEPVTLGLPEGQFTLPRQAFVPLGYLLVCFVYATSAGLAGVLINSGAALLQPEVGRILRRLVELLEASSIKSGTQ